MKGVAGMVLATVGYLGVAAYGFIDRDLRLDRQHLHLPAEPVLVAVEAGARASASGNRAVT